MSFSTVCKYSWAKPFLWPKPTRFDFSSSNFNLQGHLRSTLGDSPRQIHIHYKNSSSSLHQQYQMLVSSLQCHSSSWLIVASLLAEKCRPWQCASWCQAPIHRAWNLLHLCEASLLMLHGSNANILCASHVRSINNRWFWKCFHMSFGNGPNSLHLNPFSSLSNLQNTWELS
jgi:hypothetical protein